MERKESQALYSGSDGHNIAHTTLAALKRKKERKRVT